MDSVTHSNSAHWHFSYWTCSCSRSCSALPSSTFDVPTILSIQNGVFLFLLLLGVSAMEQKQKVLCCNWLLLLLCFSAHFSIELIFWLSHLKSIFLQFFLNLKNRFSCNFFKNLKNRFSCNFFFNLLNFLIFLENRFSCNFFFLIY